MPEQVVGVSLKKILQCIQKFCTEKVCFQGLAPDDQVAGFQKKTNELLSEELKKDSPDVENVETLATNYTLLMTNAVSSKCKGNKKLSFVRDDYDVELAKQAIDNQFKLSWKYKAAESIVEKNKKRRKLLVYILLSVFVLGLIMIGSSFIFSNKASQSSQEISELENVSWWDSVIGIFGENQKREMNKEKLKTAVAESKNMATILSITGTVLLIVLVVGIFASSKAIKASQTVFNDWKDYQILCNYLESSAQKAMEAKQLWQY